MFWKLTELLFCDCSILVDNHVTCVVILCVFRRQVRAPCHSHRSWARHDGLCPLWSIRPDFPSRQLRVWSEWCRQQLGQGSLHGGRWAGRLSARCRPQGVGELRLSAGIPADPLARWRHWLGHGHTAHQQDPRRVSRPHHEHVLRCTVAEGR